ncbi:MAG: type I phosphomannose isomerase catalytic subunit [Deinococcales bacterium]
MDCYPLKLSYHIRHYHFGERLIESKLHKPNLPAGIIAETWEISDHKDTSARILNGSLAGHSLHELSQRYPDELVGKGWRGPHFPLLAKFLDASHMLPVHLHADDARAKSYYQEPNGKSEAWHIIWAAEDASILAGLKSHYSREALFEAFKDEAYDRVMPRYPIQAGDTVYVPGGIIHSFGPDTLIFEIQQTSDLGNTVMPTDLYSQVLDEKTWDANINATLDELKNDYQPRPHAGLAIQLGDNERRFGCASRHFVLERLKLRSLYLEASHPERFVTLSNVGDPLIIRYQGGEEILARAESCILPAAIGEVQLIPQGESDLIVCYVPDLAKDVIAPLRAAGYSLAEIESLGINVQGFSSPSACGQGRPTLHVKDLF